MTAHELYLPNTSDESIYIPRGDHPLPLQGAPDQVELLAVPDSSSYLTMHTSNGHQGGGTSVDLAMFYQSYDPTIHSPNGQTLSPPEAANARNRDWIASAGRGTVTFSQHPPGPHMLQHTAHMMAHVLHGQHSPLPTSAHPQHHYLPPSRPTRHAPHLGDGDAGQHDRHDLPSGEYCTELPTTFTASSTGGTGEGNLNATHPYQIHAHVLPGRPQRSPLRRLTNPLPQRGRRLVPRSFDLSSQPEQR